MASLQRIEQGPDRSSSSHPPSVDADPALSTHSVDERGNGEFSPLVQGDSSSVFLPHPISTVLTVLCPTVGQEKSELHSASEQDTSPTARPPLSVSEEEEWWHEDRRETRSEMAFLQRYLGVEEEDDDAHSVCDCVLRGTPCEYHLAKIFDDSDSSDNAISAAWRDEGDDDLGMLDEVAYLNIDT